jgi:hypothetical protein
MPMVSIGEVKSVLHYRGDGEKSNG